jgi:hypothetical protein
MRSKLGTPSSPQATASPSMVQERERSRASDSAISLEAVHQVVPQAAVEPHPCAVLSGDDAEAVVLDFVQPLAAGRQLVGLCGKARRDEPGREGTLQHVG